MSLLRNPEPSWERPAATSQLDLVEIERRLGPVKEPVRALSGGLVNLNVLIGEDRVLRLYRQDPGRLVVEKALLERPWSALTVPQVLRAGDDFLLLEYIPHRPLEDSETQAEALGRALAEIHAVPVPGHGLIGPALELTEPFPDLVDALSSFAVNCLEAAGSVGSPLKARVQERLREDADRMRAWAGPPVLTHSDFKASNVHWCERGKPLVLDWETAYAGAALSDIGQLFRWGASDAFGAAFARAYRGQGRPLPEDWLEGARRFDLINMSSLFGPQDAGTRKQAEVTARMHETLDAMERT